MVLSFGLEITITHQAVQWNLHMLGALSTDNRKLYAYHSHGKRMPLTPNLSQESPSSPSPFEKAASKTCEANDPKANIRVIDGATPGQV